ncbi:fibrillin-1-like isoform X2 [Corticium candelabrum]|nr:fibrillin-1-like isoform X2 [Corticium candelabrum]XP_062510564.1 fibrillin-1-like isoform X2 [Corticium candelabrum]
MWNNSTCLKFNRKHSFDSNYLLFVAHEGCWSYLGFQGGEQKVSVGRGCRHVGVVAHQIGHAIGFGHEALRPDRDRYIRIMKNNIKTDTFQQYFNKNPSGLSSDKYNLTYDFESIMHFKNTSYSGGRRKLSIKVRYRWRNEIHSLGQRERLSRLDIRRANLLYSCPTDVSECDTGKLNCTLRCVRSQGGEKCVCKDGYYWSWDERQCKKIPGDDCKKLKCHKCRMVESKPVCSCHLGYVFNVVTKTCKDVDECHNGHHLCRPDQKCINTPGRYKCGCKVGYVEKNGVCEDEDECSVNPNLCEGRTTCVNRDGGYDCKCLRGYVLLKNTQFCEDVDECHTPNRCSPLQICVNTVGDFECECKRGYSNTSNPQECVDIDECKVNNGGCAHDHMCINSQGGFTCNCREGYTKDPHYFGRCLDMTECKANRSICSKSEQCVKDKEGYRCKCSHGYGRHPKTRVCVNATVLRPRSCRDIQKMELGEEDGEYQLYPNRKCSAAISIYCADMKGSEPLSYLTLHSTNNTATACSGVRPGCPSKKKWKRKYKTVSSTFKRIRVHLRKTLVYVIRTDTRFTIGNMPVPYATASSCGNWSAVDPGESSTFRIDLRGTDLHLDRELHWMSMNNRSEDIRVNVSSNGWIVDGNCSGNCNYCQPLRKLRLTPDMC